VMIAHYLKLAQAKLVEITATKDLEFDIPAIEAALSEGAKLAIFASPDNPTGAVLPVETMVAWCRHFPDTLFVMDEAYVEFTDETALPFVQELENLVVTRTFSKAWGLAGLRLGVAIAHPQRIREMLCVRSPYSVNALSVKAATEVLA